MSTEAGNQAPVREYPLIPKIKIGAMRHSKPFTASAEVQQKLGYPGELIDDWQQVAVKKMGELVSQSRGLQVFMDSCVKCGACTDKCHYYLGSHDPNNMPVARQDLFRSVYRRHYTLAGKLFPKLVGARELDKAMLDDWYNYFHQCSQCRRCAVFCPYGIDTAEISMAAREILDTVGVGQKYSNNIVLKAKTTGNNLGMPPAALADTLAGLEEDIEAETGVAVRLPLDEAGADMLLVTPSADFFAEPHVDSLIGYAKVLHQAGITWTLSSTASEAANFALFTGDTDSMQALAQRIADAAQSLGTRRIVFGECGHAWRVAYNYFTHLAGPLDFLDPRYPVPQHICEITYDLIQKGALSFDKSANDDKVLTYHDSCNVARASRMGGIPGGQFTLPRAIIRACCNHFYDMAEETIGEQTFCCGGGGGLLTDELQAVRTKGALPRMHALQQVVEKYGVTHMAAICAICKSQFMSVMPEYGFNRDQVLGVHQLVSNAIVLQ